jgi:2-polyprenyl-3-methyl-5-hydroxy-6-metoxy-1,4-benzoquinol methylase
MDDPALPPAVYAAVLADLGRVNRWTLAARPTLSFLRRGTRGMRGFRLLDVGYGEGGMLRRVARWARRRGLAADLVGIDLNPKSAAIARAATPADVAIDWRTGDYRDLGRFDFVISSLVAHHMDDGELDAFVRWMEDRADRGWLINDLHRHRLSLLGYPVLARLMRVHPIVRSDGALSIARAFRPRDWEAILGRAGLPAGAARLERWFPFRLCVARLR